MFVALKLGLNLGVFNIAIYGKTVRCSFNSFEQCITGSSLNFVCVGILSSIVCCDCIETNRNSVNQNKEQIT